MKTKAEYLEFLGSEFWIRLSMSCRIKSRFVCYRCGKKCERHNCQAHHIRYPDDWYQTTLDDLICLCSECHKREHSRHGGIKMTEHPKAANAKKRVPVFKNSMKGMIWCRPYRHWINRGTSSN